MDPEPITHTKHNNNDNNDNADEDTHIHSTTQQQQQWTLTLTFPITYPHHHHQSNDRNTTHNSSPSTLMYDVPNGIEVDSLSMIKFVSERIGVPHELMKLRSSKHCRMHSYTSPVHLVDSSKRNGIVHVGQHQHFYVDLKESGLLGGKGGFGATLRASGSRANANQKIDFGSCRDLQGRRLRHVNNEIRLQSWRQQQTQRQHSSGGAGVSASTAASASTTAEDDIPKPKADDWYLDIPTWTSVSRKRMKPANTREYADPYKTTICREWEEFRKKNSLVPAGSPPWFGCSQGQRCRYAHGHEELTAYGVEKYRKLKKQKIEEDIQETSRSIAKEFENLEQSMAKSVAHGLKKKMMMGTKGDARVKKVETVEDDITSDKVENIEQEIESQVQTMMMELGVPLQGDVGLGESGELEGRSEFATFAMLQHKIDRESALKTLYYEVEIIQIGVSSGDDNGSPTGTALQIGWATNSFLPSEESGNGVGDVAGSWGIDIQRGRVFSQGEEHAFESRDYSPGQIIGCLLDFSESTMKFFVNGTQVFHAGKGDAIMGEIGVLGDTTPIFPAISLEQGIAVRINLGNRPFLHHPSSTAASSSVSLVTVESSATVETSAPAKDTQENINLDDFDSIESLQGLGLDMLKRELHLRGLKCSGTLEQRATRLFAVRGLSKDQYPIHLIAKPTVAR